MPTTYLAFRELNFNEDPTQYSLNPIRRGLRCTMERLSRDPLTSPDPTEWIPWLATLIEDSHATERQIKAWKETESEADIFWKEFEKEHRALGEEISSRLSRLFQGEGDPPRLPRYFSRPPKEWQIYYYFNFDADLPLVKDWSERLKKEPEAELQALAPKAAELGAFAQSAYDRFYEAKITLRVKTDIALENYIHVSNKAFRLLYEDLEELAEAHEKPRSWINGFFSMVLHEEEEGR